jgi:hypothetical protein
VCLSYWLLAHALKQSPADPSHFGAAACAVDVAEYIPRQVRSSAHLARGPPSA